MFDLLATLVRIAIAAPLPSFGVLWWASARWARTKGLSWWWLGVPIAAVHLYRYRRDLRAVLLWTGGVAIVLVWIGLLWSSPGLRFAVGVAIPTGVAVLCLAWLASNYGSHPVHVAARLAVAEWRSREVVTEAVAASVGEDAKVLEVKATTGGDFEAVIVGPAGMAHADLVDALRDTLAESILRQSGLVVRNVAVLGTLAKGRVKVQCTTTDPYARTVTLAEVRGK